MEASPSVHGALQAALVQLLRPLCRLLLRHAMSCSAFEALARRVYVDVALEEFGLDGRRATVSRASILSGLTRKEVQRLRDAPPLEAGDSDQRYNRAARVLTGWVRDAGFHGDDGLPRPLELNGVEGGFAALVRRHSGDMPVRAVLDELLRVGAVRQGEDGRVELLTPAYVPSRSATDKLAILGADVADLIATIDHNIRSGGQDPRFQRKVMYHSIPQDALPAFRALSSAQAQQLLERLDAWLQAHDTDPDPAAPGHAHGRARVGMGIHYFEEPVAPAVSQGEVR